MDPLEPFDGSGITQNSKEWTFRPDLMSRNSPNNVHDLLYVFLRVATDRTFVSGTSLIIWG